VVLGWGWGVWGLCGGACVVLWWGGWVGLVGGFFGVLAGGLWWCVCVVVFVGFGVFGLLVCGVGEGVGWGGGGGAGVGGGVVGRVGRFVGW
ncbi:hypothetical protein, partial [Pseudomonas syringae group genomosp. 7]|uniref:hypothetical protein n=1 Tax=Pseudomonas syringae group genomosp. 7 TaxID=251699 RepID=UPI0037701609